MSKLIFEDITLVIEQIGDGQSYQVRVTESAAGEGRATFTRAELLGGAAAVLAGPAPEVTARHLNAASGGVPLAATPELQNRASAKSYGGRLFNAIFKGVVRDKLVETRKSAQDKKAALRIRLNLTTVPELARLPWEYLYNPALNVFYACDRRPITSVVRYLDLGEPIEELLVQGRLRVLAMVSKPTDLAYLQVELEWQQLQEALGAFVRDGQVQLDQVQVGQEPAATMAALRACLQKAKDAGQPYHVFHFVGHGVFDPATNEGRLLMEDENRLSRQVSAERLGNRLREYNLRLAVINACEGARIAADDSYTGLAPLLAQTALIPAVVAMQFKITDQAAIAFARSFYGAIIQGQPVDAALTQARLDVYLDDSLDENIVEWATPVLYMRTRNAYLRAPSDDHPAPPGLLVGAAERLAPHPLDAHFQDVVKALLEGQLVPFLGLDINLYEREPMFPWTPGKALPSGRELAAFLAERSNYPIDDDVPDLVQAAQYAMTNREFGEGGLYDALAEAFSGDHTPTPLHDFFSRIPLLMREKNYPLKKDDPTRRRCVVVTTNLDNLLERSFSTTLPAFHVVSYQAKGGEQGKFLHSKFIRRSVGGPPLRQQSVVIETGDDYSGFADPQDVDPIILKLPGSLDLRDPERKFNFAITEDQYFDYLTRKELSTMLPAELINKLRWSSHLFLGCSLREWYLRALLYRIWGEQSPRRRSWAIVRASGDAVSPPNIEKQFWDACRIERIEAALPDYLVALDARLRQIPPAGEKA